MLAFKSCYTIFVHWLCRCWNWFAQPLARMGGLITGIDAVEKNLGVASLHAVFLSVSLSSPVLISNLCGVLWQLLGKFLSPVSKESWYCSMHVLMVTSWFIGFVLGWTQARDPATASIKYLCTTAGMFYSLLFSSKGFHTSFLVLLCIWSW